MVKKYFSRRRVQAIELLGILIYREAIEKPGTSINSVLTGRLWLRRFKNQCVLFVVSSERNRCFI